MKEEHYRRIAYSNERFGDGKVAGWKSDRGRIYILYGPPDQLEKHPKGDWPDAAPATESWLYKALPDARSPVVFKFTDGGPVTRMFLIRP
jgi:hypothetical protein